MKPFFNLSLLHEYEHTDAGSGVGQDLSIIPAKEIHGLIANQQLFCRMQTGTMECFIEDSEALREEDTTLYFWVICKDETFYSYTSFPPETNVSAPSFFWSNGDGSEVLLAKEFQQQEFESIPSNALGYIEIRVDSLGQQSNLTIELEARRTLWQYHIKKPNNRSLEVDRIVDTAGLLNFETISSDEETVVIQSTEGIPFARQATEQLQLKYFNRQEGSVEEALWLPYGNPQNMTLDASGNEITPIYVYI